MQDKYLNNINELCHIERKHLPLLVFSTNFTGVFSYIIRLRTGAIYSHFMWLHEPGRFASQQFSFQSVPVGKFANSKLKLVYNPHWTPIQRAMLRERIYIETEKPKWKTRYDWVNLIGQLIGMKSLHNPCTHICSETAAFLKIVDTQYDLCNPTPDEVNRWVKARAHYKLYARYALD